MKILLFGVSNVGKTTCAKLLAEKIGYTFYDLDEEVKKALHTTLEDFINNTPTLYQRDQIRGQIIKKIVNRTDKIVFAITPMTYIDSIQDILKRKNVLAIELRDTPENIFIRLVFSDENDVIYEDRDYCEKYKDHYLNEIRSDIEWYGHIYENIGYKYFIDGRSPQEVVEDLFKSYPLKMDK